MKDISTKDVKELLLDFHYNICLEINHLRDRLINYNPTREQLICFHENLLQENIKSEIDKLKSQLIRAELLLHYNETVLKPEDEYVKIRKHNLKFK